MEEGWLNRTGSAKARILREIEAGANGFRGAREPRRRRARLPPRTWHR